jgi:hypothetical protein
MRFSVQAEDILRRAGWHAGRSVPDLVATWRDGLLRSHGIEMFPSAERALLEFGGLKIDEQGPGVTCAREPFEIDPILADYDGEVFGEFSGQVGTRLYPLGEAVGGLGFLAIGENDRVYMLLDDIRLLGNNMDEALEALLIGLQPSPLFRSS